MHKFLFFFLFLFFLSGHAAAQTEENRSRVDLLMGVDFNYRDLHWKKLTEVLVNLTPAVKWQFGDHWQVAGQALVPVINDYGDHYKKVRLNMAVLSKEMYFGSNFLKASGGIFSQEAYGIDLKWMLPVNDWLAFDAQAGLTGYCSMAVDWEFRKMTRFTGWLGSRVYLNKWDTEFRLRGGRYLYEDLGVIGECYRHFTHCTVGLYGQWSDKAHANAGFKVLMMIPPYSRKRRTVNFRPASNFRLTNNIEADAYALKMYETDPEENEREGWFDRSRLRWGSNTMKPDFNEH